MGLGPDSGNPVLFVGDDEGKDPCATVERSFLKTVILKSLSWSL